MKIRIDLDETIREEELIIKCPKLTAEIQQIERVISDMLGKVQDFILYKEDKEYYVPVDTILFFETGEERVYAHTKENVFRTNYRLYELEKLLPASFMRVSKSTILNVKQIYSITKNITSTSVVQFGGTAKEVYVSRNYYKALKFKLEEMHHYEK